MDKELLFKPALPEDDVELPGKGTVRVRGLTREELHRVRTSGKDGKTDIQMTDYKTIAAGMVDPAMSLSDVKRWAAADIAGNLQKVAERIVELSGMGDDADKEAYEQFRDEPGDEV